MKFLIGSDIHANGAALEAFLRHRKRRRGIDRSICLGDVIGYGPDPAYCLTRSRQAFDQVLAGNHEHGVADALSRSFFNEVAQESLAWTAEQLEEDKSNNHLDYLSTLSSSFEAAGIQFFHASPRNAAFEYLFPSDVIDAPRRLERNFALVHRLAFCGHTHIPGIFIEWQPGDYTFTPQADLAKPYRLPDGKKAIVNVGSIGQPRDGDPRGCYVVYNDKTKKVTFYRVAYDVDAVAQRIHAVRALDPFLGDRLKGGR